MPEIAIFGVEVSAVGNHGPESGENCHGSRAREGELGRNYGIIPWYVCCSRASSRCSFYLKRPPLG